MRVEHILCALFCWNLWVGFLPLAKADNGFLLYTPQKSATGQWYLNVESTAFSANRDNGTNVFFLDDFAGGTYGPLSSSYESDQFRLAPRITIGKSGCNGWGLQANYWEFYATGSTGFAGLPPSAITTPGLEIYADSAHTRAYTLDLEATKRGFYCGNQLLATFGARHGRLRHLDAASAVGLSDEGDFYSLDSQSTSGFNGTGLTYSLTGIRPATDSISYYLGGRLSNLFGTHQATANTSAIGFGPSGFAPAAAGSVSQIDDHMLIAETQVGVLWSKCSKQTGGKLFAKLGFEYQFWDSSNLSANSNSFAGFAGSQADVAAAAADLRTSFTGMVLGAGYAW
ncbi:MAG: hypothetical protein KDB03_26205 [Planctomycetales bacterium]|nr:hypothetical protein [Planctomycetales bacterium]